MGEEGRPPRAGQRGAFLWTLLSEAWTSLLGPGQAGTKPAFFARCPGSEQGSGGPSDGYFGKLVTSEVWWRGPSPYSSCLGVP